MAKLTREKIKEGLDQIPIETILTGVGKKRQLTTKQAKFVKGIVEGKPKAQAYKDAYDSKGSAKTRARHGVAIASKDHIQTAIEEERLRKQFKELRSVAQMREEIIQALYIEAMDKENNPPSVRVNALSVLGKVAEINLFNESKTTNVIHHKASDIKAQLMERLKSIVDLSPPSKAKKDDGMSLLAELRGETDSIPGSLDDAAPPPRNGPLEQASHTHSIPLKQSHENQKVSDHSVKSDVQDVDFIEEKNGVGNVTSKEGGGVVKNSAEDGDISMENTPVNEWVEKG